MIPSSRKTEACADGSAAATPQSKVYGDGQTSGSPGDLAMPTGYTLMSFFL